jgi:hypothetical protein
MIQTNMKNETFYTAKEKKNHFEVVVNHLQFGEMKHTKQKSVCGGKILLGIKAYDIANPNYCTEEQYNKKICKCASDRLEFITETEFVWQD